MKQAEVLGIGYKTIDRWLQKSINCDEIQHVAHGKYCKSIEKNAITAETAPIFFINLLCMFYPRRICRISLLIPPPLSGGGWEGAFLLIYTMTLL